MKSGEIQRVNFAFWQHHAKVNDSKVNDRLKFAFKKQKKKN